MSAELPEGHVWVEVTSHRARQRLAQVAPLGRSYGVWPASGGWPTGEYYTLPADQAAALSIPGVKVRKSAPRGDMFRRI